MPRRFVDNDPEVQSKPQWLKAERLASIGMLTPGLAHEVKNPLGFLLANLTVWRRWTREVLRASTQGPIKSIAEHEDTTEIETLMAESFEAVERINEMLTGLTTLSKSPVGNTKVVVGCLVSSVTKLMARDLRMAGELQLDLDHCPPVRADEACFRQILLNLLLNATHALHPRRPRGKIKISYSEDPDWVRLCVEDNGCGIPAENVARVFDPFFTTTGGTGLGLCASSILVRGMGGDLRLESKPEIGTCVTVQLPRWQADTQTN